MTGPIEGEAYIKAHFDTSGMAEELRRGTEVAATEAELSSRVGGGNVGREFSNAFENEIHKHGEGFARTIENDIGHHGVNIPTVHFAEDAIDAAGRDLANGISDAISGLFSGSGSSNPLSGVGRTLTDLITGATNTASTNAGTTVLLAAGMADLVGLIAAAVDAVQSLVALLASVPTLLGAIGVEGGILYLVFSGVDKQIKEAFKAQTPAEFQKALAGLTESAKSFVTTLVPAVKDFVHYMQAFAEQGFFAELGNTIIPKVLALFKEFGPEIQIVAGALGGVAKNLIAAFAQPWMFKFISDILPAIASWLNVFGPALGQFIEDIAKFADLLIPFTNVVGDKLISGLLKIGTWFANLADSPGFMNWLNSMLKVLGETFDLLDSGSKLVASILDAFNKAGGDRLITEISQDLFALAAFFASDAGKHFMDSFIFGLEATLRLTTFFILGIGLIVAALDYAGDAVKWLFGEIGKGFMAVIHFFQGLADGLKQWAENATHWGKQFPTMIKNAIGNLGSLLFNAGKDLIQGLINGAESMFSSVVNSVHGLLSNIAGLFPHSPAKWGPFSGDGSPEQRGKNMISDFTQGMINQAPDLVQSTQSVVSMITFGPGAVSVAYEGVAPTEDEARITGSAIGMGISSQLAARDARLAVRTL